LVAALLAIVCVDGSTRLGRPVFFIQETPRLKGAAFMLLKFRTMPAKAMAATRSADAIGAVAALDEPGRIAELLNVLKGEIVARGTATFADALSAAVHAGTDEAPRGASGHYDGHR
jgi:lipopolysaccharide/colanic/teichoic acid biosynthesis glycosyltransferase